MSETNLDDVFGEEAGSESANLDEGSLDEAAGAEGVPAEGGGEDVSLDPDLAAMLGDEGSTGGADAESGGGEGGLDLNLEGGGEDAALGGDDMGAMLGGDAPAPSGGGGRASGDGLSASKQALTSREAVNLDFLLDVKLDVTFEVGRSKMLISDLLTLGQGSVVELHRLVGEDLDLLVNGKLIAKGEVVVVNEKFGCKISEIISPEERVKHLGGY
jgi:flagellar motor switch protein FliN/FliY